MNTDDLIQKEIEEFNKKWSRIEKTMTGHISGRKIWDADTQGHDDEANYLYVDETLERHFKKSLHKIKDEAKREAGKLNKKAIEKASKKLRRLRLTDVFGEKDIPQETVKSVFQRGLGGLYEDEAIVYVLRFGIKYYLDSLKEDGKK